MNVEEVVRAAAAEVVAADDEYAAAVAAAAASDQVAAAYGRLAADPHAGEWLLATEEYIKLGPERRALRSARLGGAPVWDVADDERLRALLTAEKAAA